MYVTIVSVPGGRATVSATATADPPHNSSQTQTMPLCPPNQVDRTTGAIQAMNLVINVERAVAAAVAATHRAPDLTGPVAGVLAHPGIGRLLAVGPFESPTALDQWWHWRGNRLVRAGLVCLPVAVPTAPSDATEGTR